MDRALEGECCFSYSQELSLVVIIFLLTVVLSAVSMLGMARVRRRARRLRLTAALGNLERISVCRQLCTVSCIVLESSASR